GSDTTTAVPWSVLFPAAPPTAGVVPAPVESPPPAADETVPPPFPPPPASPPPPWTEEDLKKAQPQVATILTFMWCRRQAHLTELTSAVWKSREATEDAIKTAFKRANKFLERYCHSTFSLTQKDGVAHLD